MDKACGPNDLSPMMLQKINVVLAEKRTALTTLRTGIAVCVLPLTIASFLIVFTEHFHISITKPLPLAIICISMVFFICGLLLVRNGLTRMLFHNKLLHRFKSDCPELAELFYKKD